MVSEVNDWPYMILQQYKLFSDAMQVLHAANIEIEALLLGGGQVGDSVRLCLALLRHIQLCHIVPELLHAAVKYEVIM